MRGDAAAVRLTRAYRWKRFSSSVGIDDAARRLSSWGMPNTHDAAAALDPCLLLGAADYISRTTATAVPRAVRWCKIGPNHSRNSW